VNPYVEADLTIHPEFNIERLYYNEITADMDNFITNLFGELIVTDDHYVCVGAGWETQKIIFSVETAMSFKDCYKNLINSFTDWSSFTDINAKIIDQCDDSNDEDITLYEWKPFTQSYSTYWFSDGTRYGSGCVKLNLPTIIGSEMLTEAAYQYLFQLLKQLSQK
jgi:hypothetical protein